MTAPPPISRIFDLSNLSDAGVEVTITANEEQRKQLAAWAGLVAVDRFQARVTVKRRSASRFSYEADLSADVVQSCVVTLELVSSELRLVVSRELHLSKYPAGAKLSAEELSATAEDGPEEIQDSRYDLAAPLLEEFALGLDPYPRAPGVAFEPPEELALSDSPFAVLKAIKSGN
jgi:hypothetical protein